MQFIKSNDIPFTLQLIKSDNSYDEDATVTYDIYESDLTTIVVSDQTATWNSTFNCYHDELDVSVDWATQSIGNYILKWNISDTDYFASTMIEEFSISSDSSTLSIPTAEEITDAVWDEVLAGNTHNVNRSAGKYLREIGGKIIHSGKAQGSGSGNNQIQLHEDDASSIDGAYDPSTVAIIDGTGAGQSRLIFQYDGTTKIATVDRNWKVNPDDTSEYIIYANPGREHVNEGLAQSGTSTTITLNALASDYDDSYYGQIVFIRSGTGEDQVGVVKSYDGTTKIATMRHDWDVIPDTTSAYVMLPNHIDPDGVVDAVWDESTLSHTVSASFGLLTQEIAGLVHSNVQIDNPVYDSDNNMIGARIRLYSNSASVGTVNNVLATYTISVDSSGPGKFTTWNQVKEE
jgi:hypothetical protein